MSDTLPLALVNEYVAHKQHLRPESRGTDVVQVTQGLVALHGTDPTSPYLSLHARMAQFERSWLEEALYERRELVKVLCMRATLHVVASRHLSHFHQAYAERLSPSDRRLMPDVVLVWAGLCEESDAASLHQDLQERVEAYLRDHGPATARQINQAIPPLQAKVHHDEGKAYEGQFSVGSRLIPGMCAQGQLIRTRPLGTWRSSQYEYAVLNQWLPELELEAASQEQAQSWLIERYLAAFGPATAGDVQWWTGLGKGEVHQALASLKPKLVLVSITGLDDDYLMLAQDRQQLAAYQPSGAAWVNFLPALDPYIMGYTGRERFLAGQHYRKLFDRAGNAVPMVWVDGRVVGAWTQRKDGTVVYGLLESVAGSTTRLLESEAARLQEFLADEYLPPRYRTPFSTSLGK